MVDLAKVKKIFAQLVFCRPHMHCILIYIQCIFYINILTSLDIFKYYAVLLCVEC